MPLNRPALTLGRGPRGVQDARRWVVAAFTDAGRRDVAECAELGVSELVTNALLHTDGQIQVRVRGTRDHPRVEVRDESLELPVLPTESVEPADDDLLLTFGRGLSIVARASDAWGVELEDDGKVVWFTPATEFSEGDGPEGQISGLSLIEPHVETLGDPVEVALLGVPVADYTAFEHHFRELRREVRLLSMAHESDYPLAKNLSDVFSEHGRMLGVGGANDEVAAALARGDDTVDLHVTVSRRAASRITQFIDLLELTDAFGREERLLALARTSLQRAFQNWYLGEFVSQAEGAEPRPWSAARHASHSRVR